MSSKILVLGGTGVLGRKIVETLVKGGHNVVATGVTGRGFTEVSNAGGVPMQLDVMDKDEVEKVFRKVEPEVVVNAVSRYPKRLIGGWYGGRCLDAHNEVMVHATKGVVKAANVVKPKRLVAASTYFCTSGLRFNVLVGSDKIDGKSPAEKIGIKEKFPGEYSDVKQLKSTLVPNTNVLSDPSELPHVDSIIPLLRGYNAAMYRFERLHGNYTHGESIILRLGHLYGPGTTFGKGGEMRKDAEKGRIKLCKPASGRWSFIHVNDAAAAISLAATGPISPNGTYNLVDNSPAATAEWVVKYTHMAGSPEQPYEIGPGFLKWWAPHLYFLSMHQRAAKYEGFPETFGWSPKEPPMWECSD
eukprot:TRINITY_DN7410_c0_g1_i1.p1 TRINITY_DN7410_c0_g1~~TRINITY_DN7410_c0_g1_i1.p1  ORF type:complete len:369 (+),score=79.39 TRINITY_DN7410_c0_g1_i1:34-1107(+)